jgi:hypothetical protein
VYCTNCGTKNADDINFCAHCGQRSAGPATPDPELLRPSNSAVPHASAPPPAPGTHSTQTLPRDTAGTGTPNPIPRFTMPKLDISHILTGDWLGALITALATLGTALGLSTLLLALMHPNDATPKGFLTLITLVTSSAFGGDFGSNSLYGEQNTTFAYGMYPLTITFAALSVATLLLRRQLGGYTHWTGATIHAIRTAIITSGTLLALTLIFRTEIQIPDSFGQLGGIGGQADDSTVFIAGTSGTIHTNAVSTALFGAMWILLIATALILLNDRSLPTQITRYRHWVKAPLGSILVLLAGTSILGAAVVAGLLIQADHVNATLIAVYVAIIPGIGITAFYGGAGAALHDVVTASRQSWESSTSYHLTHFSHHAPWLWGAPFATLVILVASALYVARRSATAQVIQADILRWLAGVLIATPLLIHLAAYHIHIQQKTGVGQGSLHAVIGVSTWQAVGLIAAWGFVIAVVVVGVARAKAAKSEPTYPLPAAPHTHIVETPAAP